MPSSSFQAGAARVDITPPLGTLINGDFITHYATTIHDPLYAKALVLSANETTLALVLVDICAMPRDFVDAVKTGIQEQTGIPPSHILLAATHAHSTGSIAALLLGAADLPYRQKLPGLLIEAVRQAQQNRRRAQLAFGAVDAPEHIVCRRYFMKPEYQARNPVTGGIDGVKTNPFGVESLIESRVTPMDTQVSFLAVRGLDGHWISLLANYSLHYVGDFENGTISADYFGLFSELLREQLGAGAGFVGMMSNGTSGEANIWDFLDPNRYPKEPFAKSRTIAGDLVGKVRQTLDSLTWETEPVLAAQYADVPVAVRKPSEDEWERAKQVVSETHFEDLKIIDEEGLRRIYAREQVLLYEFPDSIRFPVQAFTIGSGCIGALGGEFFAETGLWLKQQRASKPYFTITMANGYIGYIPPAHELERGGYETWRCRTSHLQPEAEEQLRQALLALVSPGSGLVKE